MEIGISAADVLLDLDAGSKRAVLEALAADAARRLDRTEAEILAALRNREKLGSTALGRGVALPHAMLAWDQPPLVLFARLRHPVEFDARDDEAVDLVILALWPEEEAEGFLPALARICRAMRAPQTLSRLRAAQSAAEIGALFTRSLESADDEGEEA